MTPYGIRGSVCVCVGGGGGGITHCYDFQNAVTHALFIRYKLYEDLRLLSGNESCTSLGNWPGFKTFVAICYLSFSHIGHSLIGFI